MTVKHPVLCLNEDGLGYDAALVTWREGEDRAAYLQVVTQQSQHFQLWLPQANTRLAEELDWRMSLIGESCQGFS